MAIATFHTYLYMYSRLCTHIQAQVCLHNSVGQEQDSLPLLRVPSARLYLSNTLKTYREIESGHVIS